MKDLPNETDFIVVGAGIAGLRASVELASAGRVLCLAKKEVTESNTQYAQGGIAAALVEFRNSVNPSNNFAGITDGPNAGSTDLMHWIATANLVPVLQNQTHHVRVTTGSGTLTIAVDGTQVLSRAVTLPASAYVGFTAGDGSLTNRHAVSNVVFG